MELPDGRGQQAVLAAQARRSAVLREVGCIQHRPLQERVLYDKPFFNAQFDEEGRPYADVYVRDVWDDIKPIINVSKERLGYPTQKPVALLERIIEASSNPGDMVLDPFCGCGTTVVAAENLGRHWAGDGDIRVRH